MTKTATHHPRRGGEVVELRAHAALALAQYREHIQSGMCPAAAGRILARNVEIRLVETPNRRPVA